MAVENEQSNISRPTVKGLNGLAECEIKFIRSSEKSGKNDKPKVARLVNDLERITNLAEENNLKLSEELQIIISELMVTHPDRKKIISASIPENTAERSSDRKSR
jgi:hypothetical protein